MFRRIIPLATILSLLCAGIPAPALAMSTQQQIQLGKQDDADLLRTNVVETDPLLNAYVDRISEKLWAQTARKHIPYSVKILKTDEINAFSTLGGFVYVNEGLIDFVQSDDELASVIGHETGHIERNHVVTMQAKAQAVNLLFTIAALFSPILYRFGSLAEAGLLAKFSRADELQADRYGLQLMARAGYDPNAMVSMMRHLGVLEAAHSDLLTNYLASHPPSADRVAHMLGYPELDPTKVTPQERLVWALSDADRARYSMANLELTKLLKADPNHPDALLKLSQAQLALGYTSRSEQTLGRLAQLGSQQDRTLATRRLTALRAMEAQKVTLLQPNLAPLLASLSAAHDSLEATAAAVAIRRAQAFAQLRALHGRVDAVGYELPDLSSIRINKGSRLESLVWNLEGMARAVNSGMADLSTAVGGAGTLEAKKASGLLRDNRDLLRALRKPVQSMPIPSQSIALLSSYPSMLNQLTNANGEILQSVDASRAAALQMDGAIGDLDGFLRQLNQVRIGFNGDLSQIDYNALLPSMQKVLNELNQAAGTASQAEQLYNMARAHQLSVRITDLGLGTSAQRYATLQYALQRRFGNNGLSYDEMLRENLTPGDVTAASLIAADTKLPIATVIADAQAHHLSLVQEAGAQNLHLWPVEIMMGLVYLDYTDNPKTEISGGS